MKENNNVSMSISMKMKTNNLILMKEESIIIIMKRK